MLIVSTGIITRSWECISLTETEPCLNMSLGSINQVTINSKTLDRSKTSNFEMVHTSV